MLRNNTISFQGCVWMNQSQNVSKLLERDTCLSVYKLWKVVTCSKSNVVTWKGTCGNGTHAEGYNL